MQSEQTFTSQTDTERQEQLQLLHQSFCDQSAHAFHLIALNLDYSLRSIDAHTAPDGQSEPLLQQLRECLEDIRHTTAQLELLTGQAFALQACLATGQPPQPRLRSLDLCDMLQDISELFPAIQRLLGVEIRLDLAGAPQAVIAADASWTQTILLTLFCHVLRGCTAGGSVTILLRREGKELTLQMQAAGKAAPAKGGGQSELFGIALCEAYCRLLGWPLAVAGPHDGCSVRLRIPVRTVPVSDVHLASGAWEQRQRRASLQHAALLALRSVPGLQDLAALL